MGLDAIALVMNVEDHFGISLQDTEAERVRSVGDLVALIQCRINAAHIAPCPTLVAFLKIRNLARDVVGDDQLRIRPGTMVVDVLARSQRRRLWTLLDELLGSPPPALRRPPVMRKTLAGLVVATVVLAVISAVMINFAILPVTLGLAVLITSMLHLVTVRFRINPPDSLSSFGALARRVAGVTVATKLFHLRSADLILNKLTPIVVDTLGVDAGEVVSTALLIEDLGMG